MEEDEQWEEQSPNVKIQRESSEPDQYQHQAAQVDNNEMMDDSENTDLMFDSGFGPSEDDLEIYRIVFELFDRDHSGYIDAGDLRVISTKLGRDPVESKFSQFLSNLILVFNLIR